MNEQGIQGSNSDLYMRQHIRIYHLRYVYGTYRCLFILTRIIIFVTRKNKKGLLCPRELS